MGDSWKGTEMDAGGEKGRRELQAAKDESGEGWKGWSEFLSSLPLDSIQLNFEITP